MAIAADKLKELLQQGNSKNIPQPGLSQSIMEPPPGFVPAQPQPQPQEQDPEPVVDPVNLVQEAIDQEVSETINQELNEEEPAPAVAPTAEEQSDDGYADAAAAIRAPVTEPEPEVEVHESDDSEHTTLSISLSQTDIANLEDGKVIFTADHHFAVPMQLTDEQVNEQTRNLEAYLIKHSPEELRASYEENPRTPNSEDVPEIYLLDPDWEAIALVNADQAEEHKPLIGTDEINKILDDISETHTSEENTAQVPKIEISQEALEAAMSGDHYLPSEDRERTTDIEPIVDADVTDEPDVFVDDSDGEPEVAPVPDVLIQKQEEPVEVAEPVEPTEPEVKATNRVDTKDVFDRQQHEANQHIVTTNSEIYDQFEELANKATGESNSPLGNMIARRVRCKITDNQGNAVDCRDIYNRSLTYFLADYRRTHQIPTTLRIHGDLITSTNSAGIWDEGGATQVTGSVLLITDPTGKPLAPVSVFYTKQVVNGRHALMPAWTGCYIVMGGHYRGDIVLAIYRVESTVYKDDNTKFPRYKSNLVAYQVGSNWTEVEHGTWWTNEHPAITAAIDRIFEVGATTPAYANAYRQYKFNAEDYNACITDPELTKLLTSYATLNDGYEATANILGEAMYHHSSKSKALLTVALNYDANTDTVSVWFVGVMFDSENNTSAGQRLQYGYTTLKAGDVFWYPDNTDEFIPFEDVKSALQHAGGVMLTTFRRVVPV